MKFVSWLRIVPVWIALAAMVLPWLAMISNHTVGVLSVRNQIGVSDDPLHGISDNPERPRLSASALWSGEFQRKAEKYFARRMPFQPTVVRYKNQIYYSVLKTSPLPSIVIGRHKQLLERVYIDEYCARDLKIFLPQANAWASKIKEMQDFYTARGKTFIYVITPSKAARYPEFIPRDFPCTGSVADGAAMLPAYDAILAQNGIRYVDGASLADAAKGKYPVDLFERGSTHWNALAASITSEEIVKMANRDSPAVKIQPFDFTTQIINHPYGTDVDLADLLNLAHPPIYYDAPEVTVRPANGNPDPSCKSPVIAEVGGSFVFELNEILAKTPCHPVISYYYYYEIRHHVYPGGQAVTMDDDLRRRELLESADVVIFEENEQLVARSKHGSLFLDLIEHAPK